MMTCQGSAWISWQVISTVRDTFPELTVEIQGLDAHYCFAEDPKWNAFCDFNHCARALAEPGHVFDPFLKFSFYGEIHSDWVSNMFEGSSQEIARIDEVEQQLRQLYGDRMEVFRAALRIIDVHAKGVSKMRSARELKETLHKKILVCVGDGENDVSMLDGADYAFCPADAVVADRYPNVCNCGDGAVADVIYREIPKILRKKA